jgi:hypothetical protein
LVVGMICTNLLEWLILLSAGYFSLQYFETGTSETITLTDYMFVCMVWWWIKGLLCGLLGWGDTINSGSRRKGNWWW